MRAQYYLAFGFIALLGFLFIPSVRDLPSAAATGATLGSVFGGVMTYLILQHMNEKKSFLKSTLAILAISFCGYLGGAIGGAGIGYGLYNASMYITYADSAVVDQAQASRLERPSIRELTQQEIKQMDEAQRHTGALQGSNGVVAGAATGVGAGMAAARGAGYGARIGLIGGAAGLVAGAVIGGALGYGVYRWGL